ncbi:MAG: hypothetical protein ACMZI0_02655 [Symbiopectobacterium sp.]|uniref:hypothetical protein n=1 Tax=Symbiopectobacterium sp. TaxID=2952789 RepID=UPI0039E872C9
MTLPTHSGYSIETLTIWLLIVFSTITWSLVIIKSIQFSRLKRRDRHFLHAFWHAKALADVHMEHPQHAGAAANVAHAGLASLEVDNPANSGLAQSIDFQDRFERALRHQI